jgi:hypothetical protein
MYSGSCFHVSPGVTRTLIEEYAARPLTAKTHLSRAMVKLGARDRAQLVVIADESGLVQPRWMRT